MELLFGFLTSVHATTKRHPLLGLRKEVFKVAETEVVKKGGGNLMGTRKFREVTKENIDCRRILSAQR